MKPTERFARRAACPRCGARADASCLSRTGKPVGFHTARFEVAMGVAMDAPGPPPRPRP